MQSEQSIFHCPYCGHQFDQTRHQPMILCISQHTSCNQCVQKMFRNKSKQEQIDCPFRCSKIQFANIKPFRHFKEIVETKCELKTMKSVLRKQKISYDNEKFNKINKIKELEQQLVKEREKNEWLIQINQKKQRISSQTHTDKIIKQLSKEFKKQRQKMEESVRQVLAEMLKQNKTLKSKFEEHGQRITQKISVVELETKKNQKTLQKQVDEQTVIIRQLQQSLKPLEKIEKNMVTSREFEDVLSKSIKHLEADKTNNNKNVMKTDESLKLNKVESKNVQKDEVKSVAMRKDSKSKNKPQVKEEKKITDKKFSLPLNDFQSSLPLFQKKGPNNLIFEAKKEQKGTKQLTLTQKVQRYPQRIKTEPNEKIQPLELGYLGKYPMAISVKPNQLRATIGPNRSPYKMAALTQRFKEEADKSARTSRDKNSFRLQNKNNYKYQSQKNLLNESMIEYEVAQQKKVDSIMEKLQKMHGKFMVSSKSTKLKAFINEQIHLSEKEIIEKIGSKFRFQVV